MYRNTKSSSLQPCKNESELASTRPFGSSWASGSIETPKLSEFRRAHSHDHDAFWELIGFGFHRNSKIKRVRARVFSELVTHLKILV
ncbi:hypothetical protein DVH24_009167 [Malus domestica]|uniref:Uncharacterized protein n=1 Tax=Malus domestica TaxID=3750 RepID=A0A498JS00_MALDO|nr:hypothetical protein DVH24_009167 [Malus domestica]